MFVQRTLVLFTVIVDLCFCFKFGREVLDGKDALLQSYDFVIVGGGTSGLVIANRLSEDPDVTVLVIEAGELDQGEDYITIPLFAGLYNGAVGTKYDWNLSYVPQPQLNNRTLGIPIGKVVGGGSVLNKMVFDRGSEMDYHRWAELGNVGWNWSSLLPYFHKSEKYTPPSPDFAAFWDIGSNLSAHGFEGNVQSSYPPFIWPSTKNYFEAMKSLGISMPLDAADGNAIGAYWAPQSLDPSSRTRSDSRTAYYNTSDTRPNLHLLTGHQVTKLLISSKSAGICATGVEFAATSNSSRKVISGNKEVILAAGAIHTPQILQLSGVGDKTLLSKLGIPTVVDLPGVGANFQDHMRVSITHSLNIPLSVANLTQNATFNAEMRTLYDTKRIGPYATEGANSFAFLPLPSFSNSTSQIYQSASAQNATSFVPSNISPAVLIGYEAQRSILLRDLNRTDIALMEIIYNDGTVTAGLQHPFSRGTVAIQSLDPFTPPLVDPRYLANPIDLTIYIEGFKFLRTIMATPAALELQPVETSPGPNVTTDEQIAAFIRSSVNTLYHPSGTAGMLKKELGGVVDGELKVYGVQGLRVVDASVIPMLPASHLQTTVYAIAEKAADIIKKAHQLD